MKVLFIHENTLGHTSYLPRFVNYFNAHPDFNISAELLYATPLPPGLAAKADKTIPFLRRFGLDMHFSRWRRIVSRHVLDQVSSRSANSYDAVVINTQSIALDLIDLKCPLFVALDATFRQLAQSRWFSDPPLPKIAPKLVAALIKREKELFERANLVFPWSQIAAESLFTDYNIPREKVHLLPPSVEMPPPRQTPKNKNPRALFIGADFKRKGGDLLLDSHRKSKMRFDLDIVTQSSIPPEPGVRLFNNIRAHTPEWLAFWSEADFFVFPSRLETFGIVLVEAISFGLPVISSRAGAAEEILDESGYLLDTLNADALCACIERLIANPTDAAHRAQKGRRRAEAQFNLQTNSLRLANLLREHAHC